MSSLQPEKPAERGGETSPDVPQFGAHPPLEGLIREIQIHAGGDPAVLNALSTTALRAVHAALSRPDETAWVEWGAKSVWDKRAELVKRIAVVGEGCAYLRYDGATRFEMLTRAHEVHREQRGLDLVSPQFLKLAAGDAVFTKISPWGEVGVYVNVPASTGKTRGEQEVSKLNNLDIADVAVAVALGRLAGAPLDGGNWIRARGGGVYVDRRGAVDVFFSRDNDRSPYIAASAALPPRGAIQRE